MRSQPFTYELPLSGGLPSVWDSHTTRRLSSMKGQYLDQAAYETMLAREDTLLYEVYEIKRPEAAGELLQGISFIHPGKVGDEYFMTKGHFHQILDTGEVYYCLSGQGLMVTETPEGDTQVLEFRPGRVLYVLPRWAHRSVNTSPTEDLVFYFVYPANAGHDYGTIEQKGFRKLVVERDGQPTVIDNPRWKPG
ncbi:MAG: glucose-6-phosphate isomerase [Chloroflexi bacterium]|nr:glucose-6-phosphate isomerase [Chloroflexota bacterium]